MITYYSAIVFITFIFMVMQLVYLHENATLTRNEKKDLEVIALLIITGILCESISILLENKGAQYVLVHSWIKCIEFIISPCIPIIYAMIVNRKNITKKLKSIIILALVINTFCEILSVFYPFVFYVDGKSNYHHGEFYSIYIFSYYFGIIIFIYIMLKSAKKYQSKNIPTLCSMILFLSLGLSIRLINPDIHIDWLVVSMVYSMFIVYYSDFRLKVDQLTSLLNRRSYENYLSKISSPTAIIVLDVNNFKSINDTYGHQCGDAMLKVVSNVILETYSKYGFCYRIGGDEFCIILKPGVILDLTQLTENFDTYKAIENLNKHFDEILEKKYKKHPMLNAGVSKGYGIYYGQQSSDFDNLVQESRYSSGILSEVIKMADKRMYADKNNLKNE